MSRFPEKLILIVVSDVTEYEWTISGLFISLRKFTHFSSNPCLLFFKVCSFINHIKNLLYVLLRFIEHLIIEERFLTQFFYFLKKKPVKLTWWSDNFTKTNFSILCKYQNRNQTSFFINRTPQIVIMHKFCIAISIFSKKRICPVLPLYHYLSGSLHNETKKL